VATTLALWLSSDLGHGQAGDHAQRQGYTGLHRERRVTAGEDQPEPVVLDGADRLGRVDVVQHPGLLLLVVALVLAPDPVDGPSWAALAPATNTSAPIRHRPPDVFQDFLVRRS